MAAVGESSDTGRGVSPDTRVTIGLVLAILGGIITPIWTQASLTARLAAMEARLERHESSPAHGTMASRVARLEAEIAHLREQLTDARKSHRSDADVARICEDVVDRDQSRRRR